MSAKSYSFKFKPALVKKDDVFFIVFDNADKLILPATSSGTTNVHSEFRNNSWGQAKFTTNFQYRVHDEIGGRIPVLTNTNEPIVGKSFSVDLSSAPGNRPVLLFFGVSKTKWGVLRLPFDLRPFGAANCSLLASGEVSLPTVTNAIGLASATFPVPLVKNLCNLQFFYQYIVIDPGANSLGLIMSNGGNARLGTN